MSIQVLVELSSEVKERLIQSIHGLAKECIDDKLYNDTNLLTTAIMALNTRDEFSSHFTPTIVKSGGEKNINLCQEVLTDKTEKEKEQPAPLPDNTKSIFSRQTGVPYRPEEIEVMREFIQEILYESRQQGWSTLTSKELLDCCRNKIMQVDPNYVILSGQQDAERPRWKGLIKKTINDMVADHSLQKASRNVYIVPKPVTQQPDAEPIAVEQPVVNNANSQHDAIWSSITSFNNRHAV